MESTIDSAGLVICLHGFCERAARVWRAVERNLQTSRHSDSDFDSRFQSRRAHTGTKEEGKRERERELCTVSTTLVRPSLRCLRVKKIIPERSARWTNVWNGDHDRGESDDAHAFIVIVRNEGNFLGNFGGIFAFDYTDFEICFRVDAN